jgi:hypothetical protein
MEEKTIVWQDPGDLESFHKSASFCPVVQKPNERILGKGGEGVVTEETLVTLREKFGRDLRRQLRKRVPDKKATFAVKALSFANREEREQGHRGIQAQFLAGQLTREPDPTCVGITPVYASWRCVEQVGKETQFVVMPKRDGPLKDLEVGSLDQHLTTLVYNLLRLTTALVAIHDLDLVHGDIHRRNILIQTASKERKSLCFRFHHDGESLFLPPPDVEMEITDFGQALSTRKLGPVDRVQMERNDLRKLLSVFYNAYVDAGIAIRDAEDTEKVRMYLALLVGLGFDALRGTDADMWHDLRDESPKLGKTDRVWDVLWANRNQLLVAHWFRENPSLPKTWQVVDLGGNEQLDLTDSGSRLLDKTQSAKTKPVRNQRRRGAATTRSPLLCWCC